MKRSEGIKSLVLRSVHELIYRYWVDPLQQKIPALSIMKPGWRRRALLVGALSAANLGRVAITDFRVHVRRLKGTEWSCIYIGAGFSFEELYHILFPTPPEVENLRRVFLWQVPALAKQYADQGDLVVCELNPIIRWRPQGKYVFVVPRWVQQVLDVARPLDDILAAMNQNVRRNLRRVEKHGFNYVFTQAREDLDLFYHKMYRPYIYRRHGPRAAIAEYEPLRHSFKDGGLILVRRGQEPVSGMLCRILGDTCEAGPMGVHEEHLDQVGEGSNVALWWFMLDWARRNGARRFDFGSSRAQTSNGVFNFKRQWGTRVVALRDAETEWVFYGEDLPFSLLLYLNERGFITKVGDSHCSVVLLGPGETMPPSELSRKQKEATQYGLDGILTISPETGSRILRGFCDAQCKEGFVQSI